MLELRARCENMVLHLSILNRPCPKFSCVCSFYQQRDACTQTIEAADATRAARDRLATQLEESDRARNKAKLEEVAAVAQRNEFERQKRDVEGALAVAQHEAHMWHTKLNTSTERVKLQKLHRELAEKNQNLTEQRQELLELEKKCADRLKVRKRSVQN